MIAVGGEEEIPSYDPDTGLTSPVDDLHDKTELLSGSNTWSTESNYPYGMEYLTFQRHKENPTKSYRADFSQRMVPVLRLKNGIRLSK